MTALGPRTTVPREMGGAESPRVSGDPLTLVRYVCVSATHARERDANPLTIHERAWAYCSAGGGAADHTWEPVDGLPLAAAMLSTPVATKDSGEPPETAR